MPDADSAQPLSYADAGATAAVPSEPVIEKSDQRLLLLAPPPPLWRILMAPAIALALESIALLGCLVLLLILIEHTDGMGMGALPMLCVVVVLIGLLMRTSIQMISRRSRFGKRAIRIEMTPDSLTIDDPANGQDCAKYPLRNVSAIAVYPSVLLLSGIRIVVVDFDVRRAFVTVKLLAKDVHASQWIESAMKSQILLWHGGKK